MSKRSNPNPRSAMVRPPVSIPVEPAAMQPEPAPPDKYDFGATRRCPRCGSVNTRLRSVDGEWGWRDCQVAVCRHRWKVRGVRI